MPLRNSDEGRLAGKIQIDYCKTCDFLPTLSVCLLLCRCACLIAVVITFSTDQLGRHWVQLVSDLILVDEIIFL